MITKASGLDVDVNGKLQIRLYYDPVFDTPLGTGGAHMVWGLFDASGHIVDEANFVAYNRDTKKADLAAVSGNNQLIFIRTGDGSAKDVGLDGSFIPRDATPAATFTLEPGDALDRWQNLMIGGAALNRANVNYAFLTALGGANSNSGAIYGGRWMNLDLGDLPHSGTVLGPTGAGVDLIKKLTDFGIKVGGVPLDQYFRWTLEGGKTKPITPDPQKRSDAADPMSPPASVAEGDPVPAPAGDTALADAAGLAADAKAPDAGLASDDADGPGASAPAPDSDTALASESSPTGADAAAPVTIGDGGGEQAAAFLAGASPVNPVTVNLARMRSPGDIETGLGTVAAALPPDTITADRASRLAAGALALDPQDVAGTIGTTRPPEALAAMHLMLDSAGGQLLDHAAAAADPDTATDSDDARFADTFATVRAMQDHFAGAAS